MLNILRKIELTLQKLIKDEQSWNSLYIDYHLPIVERLWRQYGEYRVYLHRIHPCKRGESLLHPHPWPQAVRVLAGKYEMGIGYGGGQDAPPIASTIIVEGSFFYEMTHPHGWHYVRPIGDVTMSVQVTGKPWNRTSPKSHKPLLPLNDLQKREILKFFRDHYQTTDA